MQVICAEQRIDYTHKEINDRYKIGLGLNELDERYVNTNMASSVYENLKEKFSLIS